MKITVTTDIHAPLPLVWQAYTTPEHIVQWNAASDDWHTPWATVELHPGGAFVFRMEAKDGSMGFDFAGTYTQVQPQALLAYAFGERNAEITFQQHPNGVVVNVSFDSETLHPLEQQQQGWQAILTRFKHYVEGLAETGCSPE